MAHNMDMKKGLYPDEPGYGDWNIGDFKKELSIEGTLTINQSSRRSKI